MSVPDSLGSGHVQNATVCDRVHGEGESGAGTAVARENAKGVIRSEVGKQIGIRLTPTLEFILDAVPDTAAHLEGLLREAAERDAEVHALAATADYAGDPDPYKHDEPDEDELGVGPAREPAERSSPAHAPSPAHGRPGRPGRASCAGRRAPLRASGCLSSNPGSTPPCAPRPRKPG